MSLSPAERRDGELGAWEDTVVAPMDQRLLTVEEARAVSSYVCGLMGVHPAPVVRYLLPEEHDPYGGSAWAWCNSTSVVAARPVTTWVVIHELAHWVTDDQLLLLERRKGCAEREVHGQVWLGNYLWMLDRLMGPRFNTFHLRSTLPEERREGLPYHPVVRGEPRLGL